MFAHILKSLLVLPVFASLGKLLLLFAALRKARKSAGSDYSSSSKRVVRTKTCEFKRKSGKFATNTGKAFQRENFPNFH
jgi:hypothetical protein